MSMVLNYIKTFSNDFVFPAIRSAIDAVVPQDPSLYKICLGTCSVICGSYALVKSNIINRSFAYFQRQKRQAEAQPVSMKMAGIGGLAILGGVALIASGVDDLFHRFDLCYAQPGFCSGHINMPRKIMPQLDSATTRNFINDLDQQGLVERVQMSVDTIFPTQNELYTPKVLQIYENSAQNPCVQEDLYIVSQDGHILDGHHRWAAGRLLAKRDGECNFNVARIKMPIQELYTYSMTYPGVTCNNFSEF